MVEVFEILRHVAHKPVRANQPFEKALHQVGPFLEYFPGGGNDPLRPPVWIRIFGHDQHIAAFFFERFHQNARNWPAFYLAAFERLDDQMSRNAAAHPFDVALNVQTGFTQLYLYPPVANAVEVTNADPL